MKNFNKFLFTFALIVCASLGVSAQKGNDDKKPPKNPPQINPENKKPRDEKPPKNDDKRGGKKPGFALMYAGREIDIELA